MGKTFLIVALMLGFGSATAQAHHFTTDYKGYPGWAKHAFAPKHGGR
ncbi:MAG: hypothetical protein ACREC6_02950 [Hyphomicrobiaceae bacterium]